MNYISAEEFLNQKGKVRNELIKWLKTKDETRLYINNRGDERYGYNTYPEFDTPLLQMHQLIKFIEEKVGSKIECNYYDCLWKYQITFSQDNRIIRTQQDDLLQALWEVACNTAIET